MTAFSDAIRDLEADVTLYNQKPGTTSFSRGLQCLGHTPIMPACRPIWPP